MHEPVAGDMVLKRWIIVKSPGMAPEKKVPRNTDDGVAVMLRGLQERRPDAEMFVVRLVYGNDIWVDEAGAFLSHFWLTEPRP